MEKMLINQLKVILREITKILKVMKELNFL